MKASSGIIICDSSGSISKVLKIFQCSNLKRDKAYFTFSLTSDCDTSADLFSGYVIFVLGGVFYFSFIFCVTIVACINLSRKKDEEE